MDIKPKVIVICGPTASGKTSLSIELAKQINGEIISADSMQIYKDMDIGTAKPSTEEMQGIKHYLLDFVPPEERYSVAQYKIDAKKAIKEILEKGKVPIIVGGTGLYVDSLIYEIEYNDIKLDEEYRNKLEEIAEKQGLEVLYKKAQEIDPQAMQKISANDKKRIMRVIEIYKATGKTKTEQEIESRKKPVEYDYKVFAINWERETLYQRINKRVDIMLEQGLIEEVKAILKKYQKFPTAMQGLGYKEVVDYLDGKYTKEEMIEKIKMETRRYAKRQLTWFRKNKQTTWLEGTNEIQNNVNIILEVSNIERRKQKNKINRKKVIVNIVIVLILIYLFYAAFLLVKQPTDKVTVENGTLYQQETDIGYIIRNEKVVKGNNYKNGMEKIKNEGEKTAKEEAIYRYYSKNEEKLKEQIAELDNKIQESIKGQQESLTSDVKLSEVKLLENQLDDNISLLNKTTDISKITEYKKQINELITKKAKLAGETSAAGSYLKQLYSQRKNLEEQLNSGAEYIKAPTSGIVSYKVDGLEETLTPNNFSTINKKFLEGLKLKTGQLIATNDECGKVIDSSSCYIATISNSEQAKKAQVNDKVAIRLSNNKQIDATICYISQENEEENLIILEIDKQIGDLANYRKISFDLIWWNSTGLKVPNQAIVKENDISYVIRNRAGYCDKIPIKIKKQNDKYAIVKNYSTDELKELGFSSNDIQNIKSLSIYDELMLDPDLSKTN